MCIFSSCGQIVFGCVMVLCLILTAVATFDGRLFSWDCLSNDRHCNLWEMAHIDSLRTVAVFLCLAIICEVVALIWNLITFCACCWKKYIIHPLIGMAFLTTVCLFVAVIVYAVAHDDGISYVRYGDNVYVYSFWLAVSALILAAIDLFVAAVSVCLGSRGL